MKKVLYAGAMALAVAGIAGAANAADLKYPVGSQPDRFDWQSYKDFAKDHDLKGQSLTITGPWTGGDKDHVEMMLNYFREATGAKVSYSGSESFESDIVISAKAGTAPNVAVFPQPGLAADMARQGYLTPLPDADTAWLKKNYAAGQSWADLSTHKGKDGKDHLFTFPYKADLKSMVWYVPENFREMGYEVPKTFEDLKKLTEQIVKDGGTPWCIGLGSGAATGWPATDWVEDILLRQQPPSVYDDWVTNKVKFTDPKIVEAIKTYGWFAKNPKFVAGGPQAAATTDFRDAPKGLFTYPPKCYMMKQASFITTFFPKGTNVGKDVNFFYFPPYGDKPDLGKPVEGAGTLFGITKDNKAAEVFIQWLKTPIAQEVWMADGGFLTPDKQVKPAAYADDVLRHEGKILTDATSFRFDASDQMPGEIGTDAFWKGMVAFTTGDKSAEEVAKDIQDRWNAIK
ncbi:ABC transporter substrate-binding protein [Acidimangrovimonas sediminis]|uniref:ABC transporter substrate-binding protein n=1 Tax=Acidimangrovimonas sediminis TaxID=2056283 RepID=UPI000C80C0C4|nr:ABC transporter substrate-binding protein [Acidimangrovimonas sediminis]